MTTDYCCFNSLDFNKQEVVVKENMDVLIRSNICHEQIEHCFRFVAKTRGIEVWGIKVEFDGGNVGEIQYRGALTDYDRFFAYVRGQKLVPCGYYLDERFLRAHDLRITVPSDEGVGRILSPSGTWTRKNACYDSIKQHVCFWEDHAERLSSQLRQIAANQLWRARQPEEVYAFLMRHAVYINMETLRASLSWEKVY